MSTTMHKPTYKIQVKVGAKWVDRTTINETRKGDPIKDANHALKAYGIRPTSKHGTRGRCRLGEATSKSGKRFRAFAL